MGGGCRVSAKQEGVSMQLTMSVCAALDAGAGTCM
jgi:hypothetical protein